MPVWDAGGLLVLTIRPREYWAFHQDDPEPDNPALLRAHDRTGFAFWPHNRPPVDGDVTFGETTMKMETIEELCSKWKTIGYDRSLQDPHQLIVLLPPRPDAAGMEWIPPQMVECVLHVGFGKTGSSALQAENWGRRGRKCLRAFALQRLGVQAQVVAYIRPQIECCTGATLSPISCRPWVRPARCRPPRAW